MCLLNLKALANTDALTPEEALTKMKKDRPESYKKNVGVASERLKMAASKMKDDEAVYKQLDNAEPEFQKFVDQKVKESEDLHKKMVGNYDWRGLTPEEKQVILHFSEEGYKEISDLFAAGKKPHHKSHISKYISIMNGIMKKTDAPANMYVYAGYTGEPLEKNGEYTIPEIKATTTNLNIALAYLENDENKQLIQFKIRKHQQGFYMDGNNSEAPNQGEREFILPPDTQIKVTDDPKLVHINDKNAVTFYDAQIADPTLDHDPKESNNEKT